MADNPDAVVDISEIPVDPVPVEEGSDRVHAPEEHLTPDMAGGAFAKAPKPPKAKVAHPKLWVPFRGNIKGHIKRADVIPVKRALSYLGYLPWRNNFSNEANKKFYDALVKFKKDHPHKKLGSGRVYDQQTHDALVELRAFDKWGAHLMIKYHPGSVIEKQRAKVVANLMFGYHHRDEMAYVQMRPMDDMGCPPNVNTQLDCSEFYTWCCQCAGVPNPNGHAYNNYGYSGEMAAHCRTVPGIGLEGDGLLYEPPYPYGHVAGRVPGDRVVSMGSDPGPLLLPWNYRSDFAHAFSPWSKNK